MHLRAAHNGRPRSVSPALVLGPYLQSAVPIKGLDPVQLAHAHLVIRAQCEVHPLKAVRSNKNDVTRRPGLSICFTKDSWPIHRMVLSFPYSSSSSIFRNSPTGT